MNDKEWLELKIKEQENRIIELKKNVDRLWEALEEHRNYTDAHKY